MYIYDEQDTFPRKISIKWSLLDNTKYDKWSSVNSETFLQKMFKTTKISFVFCHHQFSIFNFRSSLY